MTIVATLLNWRPHTPFYYGWLVLAVGASGAFVATAIAGVVLGGVQSFILEDTGWNRTVIGFSASAGVWLSGLFAPFAGRLADRYGPRWLMPLGALVLGVCLISLGGVHSVWQFFLATVLGRAISQPFLIGVVPRTVAVKIFQRRRNTALALTDVFRPISGAIIIQIFSAIATTVGWRSAFRYLGLFSMLLRCRCCWLCGGVLKILDCCPTEMFRLRVHKTLPGRRIHPGPVAFLSGRLDPTDRQNEVGPRVKR